jgi:hypothetical protein
MSEDEAAANELAEQLESSDDEGGFFGDNSMDLESSSLRAMGLELKNLQALLDKRDARRATRARV